VLGASVLEAAFLRQPSGPAYLGVGLIEEAVKLAALWLLARRLARYTMRDGIVLGAAVGFGFAAFESAGYAFNALFTAGGPSLLNLVETEVLCGILTPLAGPRHVSPCLLGLGVHGGEIVSNLPATKPHIASGSTASLRTLPASCGRSRTPLSPAGRP
jgi:hypothetical protein